MEQLFSPREGHVIPRKPVPYRAVPPQHIRTSTAMALPQVTSTSHRTSAMPALPSLHYPYVFRPKNRKSMFSFEHERVQTAVGNDDVRGPTSNIEKLERRRSSYPHVFPSKLKRSKSAANLTTNADMKVPLTTIVEDQKSALDTFDEELARRIARAQRFVVEEQRRQFELYGKEDENRKKMQAEEEKQLEPPVTPLGESFNMNRPIVRGTSTSKGPLFWMDAVRNLRNR